MCRFTGDHRETQLMYPVIKLRKFEKHRIYTAL